MTIHDLPTPSVVIDVSALRRNIARMQDICDRHGVELWPHIKTHKCGEIVKLQLAAGAKGITCAKLGEAEYLLGTGVKQIFIAHALVDVRMAPRLRALQDQLDRLILAVTSPEQMPFAERLAQAAGVRFPVMVALDTGLHREGCRSLAALKSIFSALENSKHLEPIGIYTHEGHCYFADQSQREAAIEDTHRQLLQALEVVGPQYLLAPGCSASAAAMAQRECINIIRPGTYALGDLGMAYDRKLMAWKDLACTVLATVVDRPEAGLALLDAGSKSFSGDKALSGESGRWLDDPSIWVRRVNEEHGYLSYPPEHPICIGDRMRFVPAHVCTTMNMTDSVFAMEGEEVVDEWPLEARGKVN